MDLLELPTLSPRVSTVTDQIDRYRILWFGVIALFLLLSFNGQWQVGPDSAAYRQIGHELATHGRYFFREDVPGLSEYHNKQGTVFPGLPIVLAALEKTFGPSARAPLVFMLIVSAVTLVLIYRLMLYRLDRWAAVSVVVGVGTNPKFLQCANEILSDVPFLLGVVMTLLGFERVIRAACRQKLISGLALTFAGLLIAAAMRPTFWFLYGSLFVACVWGLLTCRAGLSASTTPAPKSAAADAKIRWNYGLVIVTLAVSMLVFWFVLDIRRKQTKGITTGGYEARMVDKFGHFDSKILPRMPENIGELLEHALPMAVLGYRSDWGFIPIGHHLPLPGKVTERVFLGFGAFFSLAIIAAGVWLARRNVLWGALVGCTVLGLVLMGAVPRYFVMILPLLLAGWGLMVSRAAVRVSSPFLSAAVMRLGLGFVLVLNFVASADFILTQRGFTRGVDEHRHWQGIHHVGFLRAYHHGQLSGIYDLAAMIHREVGADEKILGPEPTILTYLSGRQVYPLHKQIIADDLGTIFHRALFPVGGKSPQGFQEYEEPLADYVKAGRMREGAADAGPVWGYRLSEIEVPSERAK